MIWESGPSTAARLLAASTRLTLRTALKSACYVPHLPAPYGILDLVARALPQAPGVRRSTVRLRNASAQLFRAPGVPANGDRAVLYLHGGAFITCGTNTHAPLITRLSKYSNAEVLAVDYRMMPRHTLIDAVDDCLDGWDYLRRSYRADQIVVAGDSAGGYLALCLAEYLVDSREPVPAALALLSPLLELDPKGKAYHPNYKSDAMFTRDAFSALLRIINRANRGSFYEPLDHITPELPPVLIHVSGSEVLLHDAELAAELLTDAGVPVDVHVWPGQIHVFQIAAPLVPEAKRSLQQIGAYIAASTSNIGECNDLDLTKSMVAVG